MRRLLGPVLMLCVALGVASTALAQDAPGAVTGQLRDPNGLLITGLEIPISVKSLARGQLYTANVDLKSGYSITNLPAGGYDLSLPIQCCMYRTFEQKGITISAG